jgi:hypothetical protein
MLRTSENTRKIQGTYVTLPELGPGIEAYATGIGIPASGIPVLD